MEKCFTDGLCLALELWGQSDSIPHLPSILGHVVSWRRPNASRACMRGKPKVTPYQRETAAHLSPCLAGMNQVNPNFVCFSLSANLEEMWRNESMLEHSNCIFTSAVQRWRMVLHSHFQESLPKYDNHIKGSIPFLLPSLFFFPFYFFPFIYFLFFFLSFILHSKWRSYLAVCSPTEKA